MIETGRALRRAWTNACLWAAVMTGLLVVSTASVAVETPSGLVDRIFLSSDGSLRLRLKNDSCNTDGDYYVMSPGHSQLRASIALVALAAETGRPITVRVDNCLPGDKQIGYIVREY